MSGRGRKRSRVFQEEQPSRLLDISPPPAVGDVLAPSLDETVRVVQNSGDEASFFPSSFQQLGSIMTKMSSYHKAMCRPALTAATTSSEAGVVAVHEPQTVTMPDRGVVTKLWIEGTQNGKFNRQWDNLRHFKGSNFSESFISFVAEILKGDHAWGVVEIPAFQETGFLLLDKKDGIRMTNIDDWDADNWLDQVEKEWGIEVEKHFDPTAPSSNDDEERVAVPCSWVSVTGTQNIVGFLDYLRTVRFDKNRCPTLYSSVPFRNATACFPQVDVKGQRYVSIDSFVVPLSVILHQIIPSLPPQSNVSVTIDPGSFSKFNSRNPEHVLKVTIN